MNPRYTTVELSYSSHCVLPDVTADKQQMDMMKTHAAAASRQRRHVADGGLVVVTPQSGFHSVEQCPAAKRICHSAGSSEPSARKVIHHEQSALVSAISGNTMTTPASLACDI